MAKLSILKQQRTDQYAIIHESVKPYLITSTHTYFSSELPQEIQALFPELKLHPDHYQILYHVAQRLNLEITRLPQALKDFHAPEHRVAHIGTYHGVDFYDDSKSTVLEATQGALQRFAGKPVILFFGGVSKGVSRESFFKNLPPHIKHICLFGKEASLLKSFCPREISCSEHATLEDAFAYSKTVMQTGDSVLFSPGGASFDLFVDYKQRGQTFQRLVKDFLA